MAESTDPRRRKPVIKGAGQVQEEMQDMRTKETMESSWEKRRRKKMERWMAPPPGPPKENNNKRQAEAESDMRGRRARWESPPTIPPDNL